jgi:hypothetical protein
MTIPPARPPAPPPIPLEFPPNLPVEYVNLVRIAHSASELVFDFAHLLPGAPAAQVRSRLIMSPLSAKLFFRALADNLAKFEHSFGEIPVPGDSTLADSLFRHPPAGHSPAAGPNSPNPPTPPKPPDTPNSPQD